jgi:ABC-type lipoprotein export system ATPase subunit
LKLERVVKEFHGDDGRRVEVLRGIDLDLAKGGMLAIVGPSGSGKSTLLNIMGALDRPTAGTVSLDGRLVSGMDDREQAEARNRRVGFVFQFHHLLPQCSVLENVLVPALVGRNACDDARVERARRLLDRVGLSDRLSFKPGALSGGERQRTAVVRALINSPSLLLADEPTGSLDRKGSEELGRLLVELNAEERIAIVAVTHSQRLAEMIGSSKELTDGLLK